MKFHLAIIVASHTGMLSFRLSKSIKTLVKSPLRSHKLKNTTPEAQIVKFPFTGYLRKVHRSTTPSGRLSTFARPLRAASVVRNDCIYPSGTFFLLYYMVRDVQFVIAIYVITGIGAWAVYWLGFWKVELMI